MIVNAHSYFAHPLILIILLVKNLQNKNKRVMMFYGKRGI